MKVALILAIVALWLAYFLGFARSETIDWHQLAVPAEKPWNAMMVLGSGQIVSSEFPTERLCREALSVAEYGKTIEQKKADDEAEAERQRARAAEREKQIADYRPAHPCTTKEDVTTITLTGGSESHLTKSYTHCPLPDGGERLYDENGKKLYDTFGGSYGSGITFPMITSGTISFVQKYVCFQ